MACSFHNEYLRENFLLLSISIDEFYMQGSANFAHLNSLQFQ